MTSTLAAKPAGLLSVFFGAMLSTSCSALVYVMAIEHILRFDAAPGLEAALALYRIAGIASPAIVCVKGAILAALIWSLMELLDTPVRFRDCLASIWTAEPLLALPVLCFALAAFARGATSKADLYVPLGADVFWSPGGTATALLSHGINVFTMAWPVVVWLALRRRLGGARGGWRLGFAVAVPAALLVLMPILQLAS